MTIAQAMNGVNHLFLDTALVIYFVEQNPDYADRVNNIFDLIDAGSPIAVSSSITLAETLVIPIRLGLNPLRQDFVEILTGQGAIFVSPGSNEAQKAAELRARYNLSLTDAYQVACGLTADCEALLTNDHQFRQVAELRILVLDDLT
jgi:predicted nucleic acid-binding protein